MNSQTNWYKTFFTGLALDFWAKAMKPEYTDAEIKFIKEIVTIPAEGNILDAPCGFGRHSIALAKEGFKVTGIDIAEEYIKTLNKDIDATKLPVTAIHADVLEYEFSEDYDLAVCLGNSFSYFTYDVLFRFAEKVYAALKKDGFFVVQTGALAESILPAIVTKDWMEFDDLLFLTERTYHAENSVLQSDYRIMYKGEIENKTAFHYIFTLGQIRRLLFEAGFRTIEQYGSFDKMAYKLGDKQAYIVAGK
jgi:cyclopropane fatty-acyl-phospholipid synthase-like methyltransferase